MIKCIHMNTVGPSLHCTLISCADLEGARGSRPSLKKSIFFNYNIELPEICLGPAWPTQITVGTPPPPHGKYFSGAVHGD